MTRQQAQHEAERRWGKHSEVVDRYTNVKPRYFVRSPRWAHVGRGDSWEAAFTDAENRVSPKDKGKL